jgi:hypothetical protein
MATHHRHFVQYLTFWHVGYDKAYQEVEEPNLQAA